MHKNLFCLPPGRGSARFCLHPFRNLLAAEAAIRSENSATGPVKVYKAGESFFEPPGSHHLISENASATEPASLLAVHVADDGAQLTTFDK